MTFQTKTGNCITFVNFIADYGFITKKHHYGTYRYAAIFKISDK